MIKKLFGTAVAVALFGGVLMAQAGPAGGFAGGQVTARTGPGGGFMQGPGPMFRMRMMGRMGHGPMMWFHGRGMGQWWKNPQISQKIGLSEQQTQQLEKIHQDGRLKMIDLRANLEKQEVILGPMLQTYHPDEAQVLAQLEKVSQARAELARARIETMLASRSVLTEQQWKQLQDWRMGFHRGFGRRGFQRRGRRSMPDTPPSQ